MKQLYNYILEAEMKSNDYLKHDFVYAKAVINDLKSGIAIGLGKHNEKFVTLDPNDVKRFNKEYSEENFPKNANEFNKMILNYPSFPKWQNICKDKYSGFSANTKGQRAEGLVCYMFNNENPDIDLFKEQIMPDLNDEWIKSSQRTIDFLKNQEGINGKWDRNNYVACRVDGNDFKLDAKYKFAQDITSIFSGKKAMNKIFKPKCKNFNCNDLFTGNKDIWNKADIVLVHKTLGIDLINDIIEQGVTNGETLNKCLIDYTKKNVIIPISLKMLTNDNIHLSSVNIKDNEPAPIIESVDCIQIGQYSNNNNTGSVTIICNTVDNKKLNIVFRKTTDLGNNLNIEPQIIGDNSRLAKATAVIKQMLNIKRGNSYYVETNTNEDAIKLLSSYEFKINILKKSNYNDVTPEFKSRACCAGLLGILKAYNEILSIPIDKDFPIKFANFCVFSAMGLNGKGAFYKVSN